MEHIYMKTSTVLDLHFPIIIYKSNFFQYFNMSEYTYPFH